jgi:hypothetical protein
MEIVSGAEAMNDDGDDGGLDEAITQSLEGSLAALVSDRNDA